MGPSIADSAEWTAGESNPDLRRAMPVSSRWTSSPFEERNRPGAYRPIPPIEGPPENRTRSPSLPRRCAAGTPADRLPGSRPGRTRTCAILYVRQASSPLDDGTRFGRVARVGVEPTGTRLSTWPRCQLAYRAVNTDGCGSGSRTSASERMKLGRAPAHPQSQAPVSSRARRTYEARPGTCPPGGSSRRGEIRTPTPRGHVRLRPARLPVPPPGESRSGPCGNRTRLSSLRGWCPVPIDERTVIRGTPVGGEGVEPSAFRLTTRWQRFYRPP